MSKSKAELIYELTKAGVDPETGKPPRKVRSDIGKSRAAYKERSDKGVVRGSYINSPAKYKAVFVKMLEVHKTSDGEDLIVRDKNSIFPPSLNKYYRLMKTKDREYVTRATKAAHLEQARWRWFMSEYGVDPIKWGPIIADWYFIEESQIPLWTYTEWAWAYTYHIRGDENRLIADRLVLSYDEYIKGSYNGHPNFDSRGEIIWDNQK